MLTEHSEPTPFEQPKPRMVTVRRDDLDTLMYAFDHPGETALGSRPFKRLREALNAPAEAPSEPVGGPDRAAGPSVPPDAALGAQERREGPVPVAVRVRRGIYIAAVGPVVSNPATRAAIADDVMALADAEQREHNVACIGERNQLHGEVDRLKAEVTWERLAKETGAEKAAAEYEHQGDVYERVLASKDDAMLTAMRNLVANDAAMKLADAELTEVRAAIARVRALHERGRCIDLGNWCQHCGGPWPCMTRLALDAPTGPAHTHEPGHDCATDTQDGAGKWFNGWDHTGPAHDPPSRRTIPDDLHQARADGTLIEWFESAEDPRLEAVKARIDKAKRCIP